MKMCLGVAFVTDCLFAKGCFPVNCKSASLYNVTKCSKGSSSSHSENT